MRHFGMMCSSKRWPCFLSLGAHPLVLCLSVSIALPGPLTVPLLHVWWGRRGSQLSSLLTLAEDLRGHPLKQLNWLKAPLFNAHPISDKTQLLVTCKWAWNHPMTAGMSGRPPSYRVDGSYRLICIQPGSSLNLSHARISSVKRLQTRELSVI